MAGTKAVEVVALLVVVLAVVLAGVEVVDVPEVVAAVFCTIPLLPPPGFGGGFGGLAAAILVLTASEATS